MKNLITTTLIMMSSLALVSQSTELGYTETSESKLSQSKNHVDMLKLRKMSSELIKNHLVNYFKYPEYLLENNIDGIVKMKVKVNSSGKITEIEFIESPHEILNDSIASFLNRHPINDLSGAGKNYMTKVSLKYSLKPF